ncbi:MAG: 50S ribosomal protein L9 [Bergeyella sp.]|nr:50S ribosomal protein L9 [Bergeyella sp.]
MEIILKKDVENLGLEFDTVKVKPGYARNFLLPKGFAVLATPKNKAALEATLESRKEEEAKLISEANEKVEKLKKTPVTISAKVGTGDKLFGSVNNSDIAEALAKAGVKIDKKYIKIPGNTIKRTGRFSALIRLHRNVEYSYEFSVASDVPVEEKAKPSAREKKTKEREESTEE